MTPDLLDYLNVKLHVSNLKLRGRGAFGEVYAGEMKGLVHAFKISLDPLNAKLRKMADQELEFMMDQAIRDCSNIVQLRGWDWKNGHLITWWDLGEHSLADRLQKCADEGRLGLPPEELRRYLRDAAKAIDVVNDLAFRHRDIKPDNLLVFRDGGVRVADFGLVQFVGASTMSKSTAGTIEYIAPEALEGEEGKHGKLTRTADIYSLAATAIKLATGHGPFGETLIKIVDAKRDGRPVTVGLTASQTKAVRDALHHDPAQRPFKTATEFVAAFLNESVVGQPPRPSSRTTDQIEAQRAQFAPTSTSHRKQRDENGFTAKGRVIKAFLANHDVTPEEAFRQAGLVGVGHRLSTVANWLRNTRRLWNAGVERDGDITIPKEVLEMWRNALRLEKGKSK